MALPSGEMDCANRDLLRARSRKMVKGDSRMSTPVGLIGERQNDSDRNPNLQLLRQAHRWFDVRDAVHGLSAGGFYRGAVACAFNEFPQCLDYLTPIIERAPRSHQAYQAHELLTWAYMRRGEFSSALSHTDSMLVIKKNEGSPLATRALLSVLSHIPQQSVRRHQYSVLSSEMVEGNMFIPVTVNGTSANFMIDSGATISMITQFEANRLALTAQKVDADAMRLYGATGAETGFHVAFAKQLNVGKSQICNVSFLVLKDDTLQFPPGHAGALGLPVLLALQTLGWTPDGKFHVGFPPQPRELRKANVCFDGPEPVTEAIFQQQKLPVVLDIGSGRTVLGPKFVAKFPKLLGTSGRKSSVVLSGVSGSAEMESICLPRLALQVGGLEAVLRCVHVILKSTTPNSGWFFGRLGLDFLKQSNRMTLDFNCMKLALEQVKP
jgi:gag-polyprotein putative aspartyl protease